MELKPNCGSDRAWVYSVAADYADEEMRPELLAIKFATPENAKKWREKFEEAKMIVETQCELYSKNTSTNEDDEDDEDADESLESTNTQSDTDKVTSELEKLKVDNKETSNSEKSESKVESTSNGITASE
ncbi:hypothetical protein L9F63_017788 [Diploptera punctata]|uniref:RanBD1 domain-containing protein n=1 Tax=Diploptera punctata TaxID=6984 RepID=A0AAD8EFS7_DIPPU|nr:hypothetical protein L9F63_017788 [Diploptera punctata]